MLADGVLYISEAALAADRGTVSVTCLPRYCYLRALWVRPAAAVFWPFGV